MIIFLFPLSRVTFGLSGFSVVDVDVVVVVVVSYGTSYFVAEIYVGRESQIIIEILGFGCFLQILIHFFSTFTPLNEDLIRPPGAFVSIVFF